MSQYDFWGWATRNDVRCSDGRTIRQDAFKHNDGQTVPLVWNHQHNEPENVLGHVLLENREEGVYAYGTFNSSERGQHAKELVMHGDITQMSIYANQLKQQKTVDGGADVLHGMIREVSLVYASANPEAYIESVVRHSDEGEPMVSEEEGVIYTGLDITLSHAEDKDNEDEKSDADKKSEDEAKPEDKNDETVKDVIDSMTEKQRKVTFALVDEALKFGSKENKEDEKNNDSEGGTNTMKHNVFDKEVQSQENVLSHSDMEAIINDAKRYGSMKESALAHSTELEYAPKTQAYGINGTDWLFPDARSLNAAPEFIKRDTSWVQKVMNGVHHSPFARIKSVFADLTEADARAKGYLKKGGLKKEEVFGLLKRTTTPTTIYKKQKMDRDDVIDITDFDVVAWIKSEMRMMLDEEIARAILVGDGRGSESDDKISELNVRPIWTDADLFTIKTPVTVEPGADADKKAKAFIRAAVKSRKDYKGSGEPTLYTTEDMLTDCLLLEDNNGRVIYDTVEKLRNALRVKEIVTVPVMENLTRADGAVSLMGIIVNLKDYNVGADKGGAVNMFDDFDIDYNQQKYLIETRCSGALTKPYSAIALELSETAAG